MDEKLPQAVPAYQAVKNYVTSRIQDGTWKQGETVPSGARTGQAIQRVAQ